MMVLFLPKYKLDDFDFDIVYFPFLNWPPSYGVYIDLNLFALPEHLRLLVTSIFLTNS